MEGESWCLEIRGLMERRMRMIERVERLGPPADLVAPAAAVVEMGSVAVRERRGLQRFDN